MEIETELIIEGNLIWYQMGLFSYLCKLLNLVSNCSIRVLAQFCVFMKIIFIGSLTKLHTVKSIFTNAKYTINFIFNVWYQVNTGKSKKSFS